MARLTDIQKYEAWELLMKGGNNSDSDIAKKIGSTKSRVGDYLAEQQAIKMDRINKRVNEKG